MKTRIYTLAILGAVGLAASAAAQQPLALAPPRPGFSFPQRQTLTYEVDWRVFTAGQAVLRFEADGSRENLTASADTSGAINMIYHLSDRFQSSFDRAAGCTDDFNKQTVEGRRQMTSTLHLDYTQGRSVFNEKNLVNGQTKHVESPVSGCVTDLLSGVFYASSQPIALGHSFVIPVFDAMQIVPVTMKVEGREEIKTPLGVFKTLRVQPTAASGVVKNRGNIWIWYTDDDRHLPVQMRARLFWGTITFRLIGNEAR